MIVQTLVIFVCVVPSNLRTVTEAKNERKKGRKEERKNGGEGMSFFASFECVV